MITVRRQPVDLTDDENMVFHPSIFAGSIVGEIQKRRDKKLIEGLTLGLKILTGRIYKAQKQKGSVAVIFLKDTILRISSLIGPGKYVDNNCPSGTVAIIGVKFTQKWSFNLPGDCLLLYEENYLPEIYLDPKTRQAYGNKIRKVLEKFKSEDSCLQNSVDMKMIGKGSYANVFRTSYDSALFALKFSKVKPEAANNPYDISYSSWHEVYYLKDIINPLVSDGVCPNLPYLYDTFTCSDCTLTLDSQKVKTACSILAVELASGTLTRYLTEEKRSHDDLMSALFQVMAGLHTIQAYSQMMNFDVKKENVLVYDVVPGGYWKYTILGDDYYVPNKGKMFVLNDFGIARPMAPETPVFKTPKDLRYRLGTRLAVIVNDKFVPFNTGSQFGDTMHKSKCKNIEWEDGVTSTGAEYSMDRSGKIPNHKPLFDADTLKYLKSINHPIDSGKFEFFNPSVIPPFEFYNDTQDAIRMFVGGKRTTQKGYHNTKISSSFVKELGHYVWRGDGIKDANMKFPYNPAYVTAGHFIKSFFQKHPTFSEIPKDQKVVASYYIS
jgi:hypothetical protein